MPIWKSALVTTDLAYLRFFRLRKKITLSPRLQCDFLLKKSVKTLRLRQVIQLFSSTVALFTNASRNCVDFISAMLIEHRPFLTLYQTSLIIFSYIQIDVIKIVWQKVRGITNEILELKGYRFSVEEFCDRATAS